MLRTALTPRWLGLLALVVAVMVAFTFLGLWQLDVARDQGREEEVARVKALGPTDVTTVLRPHTVMGADAVGREVTAVGSYDLDHQVLVAGRRLGERTGFWVLTPLVVESSKARLPVLRGFVTDPSAVPPPPTGRVRVSGVLSPPESAPNDPKPLPAGQIQSVDLADLVNEWSGELYTAMVFAADETPPATSSAGLTRIPPIDPGETGIAWRNLAYALQWWMFAAFALYMWWRMVREDHESRLAAAALDAAPPAESPRPSPEGAEHDPEYGHDHEQGPDHGYDHDHAAGPPARVAPPAPAPTRGEPHP